MAQDRLINFAYISSKYASIIMNILFILFFIAVLPLYISDENIREFCINVSPDEYYHFRVSEHNACLIDWWYFVREPIFGLFLIYVAVVAPFVILHQILKRKIKLS